MKLLEKKEQKKAINSIGEGTILNGEIQSGGDIRIDGILNGSVKVEGKLVLGPAGKIEGEVECENAIIAGELRAKITSKNLLTLKASAKLYGDIFSGKLEIEPGAIFTGNCSMGIIKDLKEAKTDDGVGGKNSFTSKNEKTA
tara:strand:+ start:90 stop:515 length:426 start_codon:yes stop_codon:yes gene_type:complete